MKQSPGAMVDSTMSGRETIFVWTVRIRGGVREAKPPENHPRTVDQGQRGGEKLFHSAEKILCRLANDGKRARDLPP